MLLGQNFANTSKYKTLYYNLVNMEFTLDEAAVIDCIRCE